MHIDELVQVLNKSNNVVFFGGAGVSTESDIPDFRSENGIFRKKKYQYPAEEMVSIQMFNSACESFYEFYFNEMVYPNAQCNDAHIALAKLEKWGIVKCVITQNIDGLHQKAGSKNVIELHGSVNVNHCVNCYKQFPLAYMLKQQNTVPKCDECGDTIKCDVVLYGEGLNELDIQMAIKYISEADVLIIGGTSLSVYPASGLLNYFKGEKLILINKQQLAMDERADIVIHEPIGSVFKQVSEQLEKLR